MQLTLEGRFSARSGGAPWIARSAVPAPACATRRSASVSYLRVETAVLPAATPITCDTRRRLNDAFITVVYSLVVPRAG
jgi:hypothetical protein